MKYINFFIFIVFTAMGCSDDEPQILDQTFTFAGKVMNSSSGNLLAGVTVGIKSPEIPDSLIFHGDSLNTQYFINLIGLSLTDTNGQYRMDWFLGYRNESLYDHIFAYKPGYQLWLYKYVKTGLRQTSEFRDELDIRLDPN